LDTLVGGGHDECGVLGGARDAETRPRALTEMVRAHPAAGRGAHALLVHQAAGVGDLLGASGRNC